VGRGSPKCAVGYGAASLGVGTDHAGVGRGQALVLVLLEGERHPEGHVAVGVLGARALAAQVRELPNLEEAATGGGARMTNVRGTTGG
jgi:hypothetical protein